MVLLRARPVIYFLELPLGFDLAHELFQQLVDGMVSEHNFLESCHLLLHKKHFPLRVLLENSLDHLNPDLFDVRVRPPNCVEVEDETFDPVAILILGFLERLPFELRVLKVV